MPLDPGQIDINDEWVSNDALAPYIEAALTRMTNFGVFPTRDVKHGRRTLLIGLSTGIIDYLKAHDVDSFLVMDPQVSPGTVTMNIV